MAALTVVYVVITLLDDQAVRGLPEVLAVALSLLFLLEFSARCLRAQRRGAVTTVYRSSDPAIRTGAPMIPAP